MVRSRHEDEAIATVSKALAYIQDHLDEELSPGQIADVACYSSFHFHRLFRAVAGESVMDLIRRLRLEKAAYRLNTGRDMIGVIAMDAGYGSQEAFTRIFQAYFGIGPKMFRCAHSTYRLPSVSGVHYSPGGYTPLRTAMEPKLLDDSGLCIAHKGCASDHEEYSARLLSIVTEFYFPELPVPPWRNAKNLTENEMNSPFTEIDNEIENLLSEVGEAKKRLLQAQKKRPKEPIEDYVLKDKDGNDVRLSDLFAGKDDMILIHNMGVDCIYCTIWADGLMGLLPHISDRTSLVLCSPDKPEVQKRFATKRNWQIKMVSAAESSFTRDMGFWRDEGPQPGPWPGVSVFKREPDGSVSRVGRTFLGAAYDCAVWPLIEMLEGGTDGWEPKYSYEEKS